MANKKTFLAKKAAWLTVQPLVREFRSKAKRQPFRSVTLLTAGGIIGGIAGGTAGWLAGRNTSS